MQHYAPHASAVFEGHYSKFDLPSGASLALIISTVPQGEKRPHMVSFTYVPKDPSKVYQKELWVDSIERRRFRPGNSFDLRVPGLGYSRTYEDSTTTYDFEHEDFSFHAKTTTRTPWAKNKSTPEGLLVYLPLPLHWHVHSLASECTFQMRLPPSEDLPQADREGKAIVHQEKNWANSFPAAHMWLQARDGDRGFCCAGGQVLGMEAFLLGYRSSDPRYSLDFRPPFALKALGVSPFMSVKHDWESRRFELSVQSFRSKIKIKATAPKGSFFSLSSPFPEGHRENFLGQSFQATFEIQVFESGWFSPWRLVHTDRFEGASLEFGGGYYHMAGSGKKFN